MSESQSIARDATTEPSSSTGGETLREAVVVITAANFDGIGLDDALGQCRDAGLRALDLLATHETRVVLQVEVDHRLSHAQLTALKGVEAHEYIHTPGETHLHVLELGVSTFPTMLADQTTGLLAYDVDLTTDGLTLSLVGPQSVIASLIEDYQAAGLSPHVEKLGAYNGQDHPLDALTDRQREVLETAFEMGYFDVPRNVTGEDLATELDLNGSTVTEHLQRAEHNLLATHFTEW